MWRGEITTGIRTEEARALRRDHVDLDGEPPHIDVFRSVRAHGDVKTRTSGRTLALPALAVAALTEHREKLPLSGRATRDLGATVRVDVVPAVAQVRRA
jgi:integrase